MPSSMSGRLWRAALLVLVLTVAAACGQPCSPCDRHDFLIGGRPWTLLLAGADGMRGLDGFDGTDGMLFDFDQDVPPDSVGFVMDGVAFPLDIAWFTDAGELVGTASMAMCPARPCPVYTADGPYRWAVEAPPGAFDDLVPTDRFEPKPP